MPLIGSRLREIRERRTYTQEELAERLGVAPLQIWRYEQGKNDPSGDILAKLATILEVTTDYLLGLVNEPDEHLTEDELTPMERKLLNAYRRGELKTVLQILAAPSPQIEDKSDVAREDKAVNG